MIVVHVTHEAVEKMGGIGAVISGLATADAYARNVSRTILVGPLFRTDRPADQRLGPGGTVIYSSLDGIVPPPWREKFLPIERTYDAGIVYGRRIIDEPCTGRKMEAEVLLVDVFHVNHDRLNLFKDELYKRYGVPSDQFEKVWEYEEYVRLAEPGFEALKAIGCNGQPEEVLYLAHEYMGMPLALKAAMSGSPNTRTVFYAHEVASVRPLVEKHQGHDTMFYNVMREAAKTDQEVQDLFPQVHENFKHPLVRAARYCDRVFAVGDFVREELRFLDRHFRTREIDLVYNGIPSMPMTLEERKASRARMKQYAKNLLGFEPTWTFTHVARPVLSKGVWRDLAVLHHLELLLAGRGESAVYFMLGTLGGQRRPADVLHMERVYGWPVNHEAGYPDLAGEDVVWGAVDAFNRGHTAAQAVLVNQWDWNQQVCGERMPADMTFRDIRAGTDMELGLSVYEPFGISQLEPLCCGALCLVSNVCGCTGFARRAVEKEGARGNIIEADFTRLDREMSMQELLAITIPVRDRIESAEARRVAALVAEQLPRGDAAMKRLIADGQRLAEQMSWERVVDDYFMPSLRRAAH